MIIEDLNTEAEEEVQGDELVATQIIRGEQMSSNGGSSGEEGHSMAGSKEQEEQKQESVVPAPNATAPPAIAASAASLFGMAAAPAPVTVPHPTTVAPVSGSAHVEGSNTAMAFFGHPAPAPVPDNAATAMGTVAPMVANANTVAMARAAAPSIPPVGGSVPKSEDQPALQQQQQQASLLAPSAVPVQNPTVDASAGKGSTPEPLTLLSTAPPPMLLPKSSSIPKFKVPEQHGYNTDAKQNVGTSSTTTPPSSLPSSVAGGSPSAQISNTPNATMMTVGTPITSNKQSISSTTRIATESTTGASSTVRPPTIVPHQPTSMQTAGFKLPKFNKPHHPSPRISRQPPPSTLLSSTPDRSKNISTPSTKSTNAGVSVTSNTSKTVASDTIKRTKVGLSLPTPSSGISRTRQFSTGGRFGGVAGLGSRSSG